MEGDSDSQLKEVGIIGAGLAGTTLAIALKQSGLSVRLYDQQSSQPSADGLESETEELIELSANGTRVLHALGLKQALADIATFPEFSTIRHARTGFLLSQRPLGAFSEARYGAPSCLVARGRLTRMLRQAAIDLQIPLQSNTRVNDVDTALGIISQENGHTHRHLAIALASGRPEPEQPAGLADTLEARNWQSAPTRLLRAVGERAEPSRDHARFINTWVHDGLIVLERPFSVDSDDQRVELIVATAAADERVSDNGTDALLQLLQKSGGLHSHLRNLLSNPSVSTISPPIAPVASYWHAGKTVLLGEACHAHPTFPSLSPSAALEDAWVLSRMMERWEESPHEGFPDYARYRKPRADKLRAFASAETAILLQRQPTAVWRRNLSWSLTSRFLPEIAMQRLDWLYGYDCIRGFA